LALTTFINLQGNITVILIKISLNPFGGE